MGFLYSIPAHIDFYHFMVRSKKSLMTPQSLRLIDISWMRDILPRLITGVYHDRLP